MLARYGLGVIGALTIAACGQAGASSDSAAATTNTLTRTNIVETAQTGSPTGAQAIVTAAADTPAGQCRNILGRMMDPDPVGRNVRNAPGTGGRVLGVIPPPFQQQYGTGLPATFSIIGSRNGWLLIENARFNAEQAEGAATPAVFGGRGWISGRGVSVEVQTGVGFSTPSHDSPIAFDARDAGGWVGGSSTEGFVLRGVAGCSGYWVQLDWESPGYQGVSAIGFARSAVVSENPLVVRGWFSGVCNNEETTCDGTNGDTPENAFADQTTNSVR